MTQIEFHCEHCNRLVQAPEETGGKVGKCPHCKQRNYIPLPAGELEELPLAPIDEEFERHRRQAAAEDAAYRRQLLQERSKVPDAPERPAKSLGGARPPAAATSAGPIPRKKMTSMIVSYMDAMASGTLDKADKIAGKLSGEREAVSRIVDEMMTEDLSGYGLPSLPRQVLVGFLKHLRDRI